MINSSAREASCSARAVVGGDPLRECFDQDPMQVFVERALRCEWFQEGKGGFWFTFR
jgi:hypothetical protein